MCCNWFFDAKPFILKYKTLHEIYARYFEDNSLTEHFASVSSETLINHLKKISIVFYDLPNSFFINCVVKQKL
jgi:hypothetical protein